MNTLTAGHPARTPGQFDELDDQEWELIAALHGPSPAGGGAGAPRRGRPAADPRAMVNAALWRLCTGAGWLTLPARYPSPTTCRRRYEQWLADGTWQAMAERLGRAGRAVPGAGPAPVQARKQATFCSALMG
ncbi:transposase [Pseudoduganella namucuonensis]|uniref:Transposase n=1 Tax=Pseudoduganella namucuonensis TaxID=1035707 RepID=A0A1I7LGX8_9BURK|nr:transposase [Pseudoduganella namucuonensis]SFV08962.1 Transposase [Pseudoduganella namucuonensis]